MQNQNSVPELCVAEYKTRFAEFFAGEVSVAPPDLLHGSRGSNNGEGGENLDENGPFFNPKNNLFGGSSTTASESVSPGEESSGSAILTQKRGGGTCVDTHEVQSLFIHQFLLHFKNLYYLTLITPSFSAKFMQNAHFQAKN